MANVVYNDYKEGIITGDTAFSNSTADNEYAVLLTDSSYTPTETDTATTVANAEIAAYTGSDRQFLTGVSVNLTTEASTSTDDYYKVDAADCEFGTNTTITASGAVIVKLATPGTLGTIGDAAAIDKLITFVDFGGSKSSSGGDFTIVWNANGILNIKQGT